MIEGATPTKTVVIGRDGVNEIYEENGVVICRRSSGKHLIFFPAGYGYFTDTTEAEALNRKKPGPKPKGRGSKPSKTKSMLL